MESRALSQWVWTFAYSRIENKITYTFLYLLYTRCFPYDGQNSTRYTQNNMEKTTDLCIIVFYSFCYRRDDILCYMTLFAHSGVQDVSNIYE